MTLELDALIGIVVGIIALIVAIAAFLRANPNATPAALDAELVRLLAERQADREWVGRVEVAYQTSGQFQRDALDTVTSVLRAVAPLTPGLTDDALLKLLDDIRKRDEPPATTSTPENG
jgi:hypothetical protein